MSFKKAVICALSLAALFVSIPSPSKKPPIASPSARLPW